MLLWLAQNAASQAAITVETAEPWWHQLLHPLFLTLLFIFLTTVLAVLIKQRRRDRCLKLLNGHHAGYSTIDGRTIWGDLRVFSKGLQVVFDAPYRNNAGMLKTSALIYETEMAQCLALCRVDTGLTGWEKWLRRKQISRTVHPNIFRRLWRWIRNLFNTLNDAFSKAFSTVLGHITQLKTSPTTTALAGHRTSVDQIGQTLLSAVANAYEPLLERLIGKPVILELASPAAADAKPIELHGYLAEYSDKFIAVLNPDHTPFETIDLELTESVEREGLAVELDAAHVRITCKSRYPLVVRHISSGERKYDLAVALTNGSTLSLRRESSATVGLRLERTSHIDVVCPRTHGTVHFGSDPNATTPVRGLPPGADAEGIHGVTGSQAPTAAPPELTASQ